MNAQLEVCWTKKYASGQPSRTPIHLVLVVAKTEDKSFSWFDKPDVNEQGAVVVMPARMVVWHCKKPPDNEGIRGEVNGCLEAGLGVRDTQCNFSEVTNGEVNGKQLK